MESARTSLFSPHSSSQLLHDGGDCGNPYDPSPLRRRHVVA
jgi:hypothetical protein